MFDDPTGMWGTKKKRKRTLTAADKKRIAANQKWKCKRCGKPLPARFHVDHIKEFSEGGSDRESNLQALCPNCHAEKTEHDRHKKKQKKIKEREERERSPFSLDFGLGGGGNSRKRGGIMDMGVGFEGPNLLGSPKKKKKGKKKKTKPKGPFDFGF